MKKAGKSSIIAFLIFVLFTYFIYRNEAVIRETYKITISHVTGYIMLALIAMALSYILLSRMYAKTFEMVGIKRSFKEMLSLSLEALAINLIVPTAGISMAVLFADDAKDHNESPTAGINGVFLTFLADYTAISILLLLALIFLYFTDSLNISVAIPAGIFFLLTIGAYLLTFLAFRFRKILMNVLVFLVKITVSPVLKLMKKEFHVQKQVRNFVTELSEVSESIQKDPKDLFLAIILALGCHFMRIVTLYIIFISLGIEPLYRIILAGYAIGALFVVVSPTPNGVGFVETSMTLLFVSLGVPAPVATTATIIYRAFEFWIPFTIGFLLLQRSRIAKIKEETLSF